MRANVAAGLEEVEEALDVGCLVSLNGLNDPKTFALA